MTHTLIVSLESGHDACLTAFKADDHQNHCGNRWWLGCLQYELVCPHTPPGSADECRLWMECDHSAPDPEDYPCLPECADDCGQYRWIGPASGANGFDRSYTTGHWCANQRALNGAEGAWEDSHPHGPYEPSTGCWAQWALHEDPDAASGFEIGVHEVHVGNDGYMDESILTLEPANA